MVSIYNHHRPTSVDTSLGLCVHVRMSCATTPRVIETADNRTSYLTFKEVPFYKKRAAFFIQEAPLYSVNVLYSIHNYIVSGLYAHSCHVIPPILVASCFDCFILCFCSPRQRIESQAIDLRPKEPIDTKELESMDIVA